MLENLVDDHVTGTCISKLIPPQEERGVEEAGNLCEENRSTRRGRAAIPTGHGGHVDRWSEQTDCTNGVCVFTGARISVPGNHRMVTTAR